MSVIRLVEVSRELNIAEGKDYKLREVYVNPEHVVMIREEKRMRELNERGSVASGLDEAHQFSKITINRGPTGTEIVVVGSPDVVENTLNNAKRLLRG